MHGLCEYEAPGNTWDETLVSWGGVLAQICIGGIVLSIAVFSGASSFGHLGPIVAFLGYINLMIAAINLAPTPGLDGHKAWRIFPMLLDRIRSRRITNKIVKRANNTR